MVDIVVLDVSARVFIFASLLFKIQSIQNMSIDD